MVHQLCNVLLRCLKCVFRIGCVPFKMVAGTIRAREPPEDATLRTELLRVREEHAQCQTNDYSHVFRKKSRIDLIRLSCIIVGIEFAYAAETAFVSPLLLEIGIEHKLMTMVWSLSPLLGFILAPLLGSLSDRCHHPWGRRRPLIFSMSIFIFAGLILVAWGKDFGVMFGDKPPDVSIISPQELNISHYTMYNLKPSETSNYLHKYAAIIIIIGTIMLDFSADNCQTPSRTYLLDICIPDDQAKGLSTFTIMAGFGGSLGYALGGINWEEMKIGKYLGGNIKTVFIIVTLIFVISCIITLTSFREIPLTLLEHDELLRPLCQADIDKAKSKNNNVVYAITKNQIVVDMERPEKTQSKNKVIEKISDNSPSVHEEVTLKKYLKTILIMPKSLKILCFTNLLSWMAHTSYCLYFTDFVGESIFMGDPTAPSESAAFLLYQAGLRFGCWGMAIFALSCAIYSMAIERLIQLFGAKIVYIGGLLMFGIGMFFLSIYPTKLGVLLLSIPAGVIYATVFTIPYLLIANYHASGIFKIKMGESVPLKQTRGLGTDVAVISSMMFIAQVIVSLSIGPFISFIGSTNAIVYAASGLGILAAISATQVMYVSF